MCTLRELYGPGVEKLRIDQRVFVTPSNRKLDVNVVQSNYHIELTPSYVGAFYLENQNVRLLKIAVMLACTTG